MPAESFRLITTTPQAMARGWHPTPARQFVIVVRGVIDVEVSDGETRRLEAGSMIFFEDVGGKGHLNRIVDDQEILLAFLLVPQHWSPVLPAPASMAQNSCRPCEICLVTDSGSVRGRARIRIMTHITGHDRSQTLLLPESLDEYVGQDNPVRFIDAFVDGLDLTAAGFIRVAPKGDRPPGLRTQGSAEALHLRLPQPRPVEPPTRSRNPSQYRSDLAAAPLEARLQDHRRFPPDQPSTPSARSSASSCCSAASWTCSAGNCSRSTAPGSRRSTTRTATSPARR